MKEYLTVTLKDSETLIIVDQTLYNNDTYFLTAEMANDTKDISDDFKIYLYEENNNELTKIEDENLNEELKIIFSERLEKNSIEYDLLENISSDDFVSLTIKDIKEGLYVLKYEGKIIEKYLEFFTNTKPKVNDVIYISKKLLDIKLLSYGHFNNYENITEEDVLILQSDKFRAIYRRLYG